MLHTSEAVDWEVCNCPPPQPVQYYSILKKKREFNQLIKQYDTQIFKHGYLHYCGIVPKSISSTFNDKYELFIIFFDEVPNTSFIGFRVKVSKETFIHESNSLLLFLKKIKKPIFYLMNNNCIHVQCGTNAWELFYLLYDKYLRQYVLTVIGTQFFNHFVYSFCIQKEIQLLELLFKGSKIIRISKKSIYYKIHRKRKISVSNLIYMTLNMPKSKRCIISFNSKAPLSHSDMKNENFYTCAGSKIHVSKLILKRFKKQIQENMEDSAVTNRVASVKVSAISDVSCNHQSEMSDLKYEEYISDIKSRHISSRYKTLKRKLEETESDEYDSQHGPATSKYLKVSESLCPMEVHEDQWKQYTNIKPYTVETYSGIQCLKNLVPHLLNNGKSSHLNNSDCYLFNNSSLASLQNNTASSSPGKETVVKSDLTTDETCETANHIHLHSTFRSNHNYESLLAFKGGTSNKLTNCPSNTDFSSLKFISSNPQIPVSEKHDPYDPQSIGSIKKDNEIAPPDSVSSPANLDQMNSMDGVNFMTAAGKTINISTTAMLTAHRLIADVCDSDKLKLSQAKNNCDSNKRLKKLPIMDFNDPHGESESQDMCLDGTCVTPCIKESLKDNKMPSKKSDVDLSESIYENYKLDNIDIPDVSFSTAAGKTLTVSNTAIQAAQKLIQDVFKEESVMSSADTNYNMRKNETCKNSTAFRDIGFPLKKSGDGKIDEAMDETLIEKFFEDTVFDENELGTTYESNKNKNVVVLESKNDKNLPTCRPRKSLGGRRSMKFSSDKL